MHIFRPGAQTWCAMTTGLPWRHCALAVLVLRKRACTVAEPHSRRSLSNPLQPAHAWKAGQSRTRPADDAAVASQRRRGEALSTGEIDYR